MVTFVSQLFIVRGWSFETAQENAPYLHAIINDLVKNNKVEIISEEPTTFIYQLKDAGNLSDSTHAFVLITFDRLNLIPISWRQGT